MMHPGKHVLVIGAGGFVGRHLVDRLIARGDKVVAASRHPIAWQDERVEGISGEWAEPEDFTPWVEDCRAVLHVASGSIPGQSPGGAAGEVRTNLYPMVALLQAMQRRPEIPLVYVSSGGSIYASSDGAASDEHSRVAPRSYHGAAKVAAEAFIQAWCHQWDTRAVVLRPSNIYGHGQHERRGFGVIPAAFGAASRGETVTIWGDGSTLRDYLFVDDFVDLCMRAMDTSPPGLQVVNAASGVSTRLIDLLDLVEEVSGMVLPRRYEADRAVDASAIRMDTSLAAKLFHWRAKTPLKEGLERTWAWLRTSRP